MITFLAEGGMTPPPAQNNFGDTLSDGVAGPTALLIIVLLAIGTVLLIRNMNGHLKRLPERFPVPAGGSPAGATVAASVSGAPSVAERGGAAAQTLVRPATAEAGGGSAAAGGPATGGAAGTAESGPAPAAGGAEAAGTTGTAGDDPA